MASINSLEDNLFELPSSRDIREFVDKFKSDNFQILDHSSTPSPELIMERYAELDEDDLNLNFPELSYGNLLNDESSFGNSTFSFEAEKASASANDGCCLLMEPSSSSSTVTPGFSSQNFSCDFLSNAPDNNSVLGSHSIKHGCYTAYNIENMISFSAKESKPYETVAINSFAHNAGGKVASQFDSLRIARENIDCTSNSSSSFESSVFPQESVSQSHSSIQDESFDRFYSPDSGSSFSAVNSPSANSSDGTPRTRESLANLSEADKYQRMREQNNVASKHYRDRKKNKKLSAEQQLKQLLSKNDHLKHCVKTLECNYENCERVKRMLEKLGYKFDQMKL